MRAFLGFAAIAATALNSAANGQTATFSHMHANPLVTGQPHRVDYNNGRLYVNGVLSQGNLGNTNTTPIPPGQSVGVGLYPVTTGSGSADMTIVDTYI